MRSARGSAKLTGERWDSTERRRPHAFFRELGDGRAARDRPSGISLSEAQATPVHPDDAFARSSGGPPGLRSKSKPCTFVLCAVRTSVSGPFESSITTPPTLRILADYVIANHIRISSRLQTISGFFTKSMERTASLIAHGKLSAGRTGHEPDKCRSWAPRSLRTIWVLRDYDQLHLQPLDHMALRLQPHPFIGPVESQVWRSRSLPLVRKKKWKASLERYSGIHHAPLDSCDSNWSRRVARRR